MADLANPIPGASVFDCDETHERRARLRPSRRGDRARDLAHDFNNALQGLRLAVERGEERLAQFYEDELRRKYLEAIGGNPHQEESQGAAA